MFIFFFFNDTATTEIYTLSLQRRSSDLGRRVRRAGVRARVLCPVRRRPGEGTRPRGGGAVLTPSEVCEVVSRSEEHTSELQSRQYLVCRLLLEKKKQ